LGEPLVIALDAMGGDHAPKMVLKGVKIARKRYPNVRFLLFGDEATLTPLLKKKLAKVATIRHAPDVVTGDTKPSVALRTGRQSSMWLAIKAVKEGEAAGVVSAGNTGALMAMAKIALRTLPGIDRPAIAAILPTMRGESVMLDVGANSECTAKNLVDFAIMGEVFARTLLGVPRPSVALLNIGSEELKGTNSIRDAATLLRERVSATMDFRGYCEGNDIGMGTVDVVIADGFTGNVALKTLEGTAKLFSAFLRDAISASFLAKIGYLLARPAFERVKLRADPRRYNGAMFLGLGGICVKSHGGTDAVGFANAIGVAVELISNQLNAKIRMEIEALSESDRAAAISLEPPAEALSLPLAATVESPQSRVSGDDGG